MADIDNGEKLVIGSKSDLSHQYEVDCGDSSGGYDPFELLRYLRRNSSVVGTSNKRFYIQLELSLLGVGYERRVDG
jgi:hypothetical protein